MIKGLRLRRFNVNFMRVIILDFCQHRQKVFDYTLLYGIQSWDYLSDGVRNVAHGSDDTCRARREQMGQEKATDSKRLRGLICGWSTG